MLRHLRRLALLVPVAALLACDSGPTGPKVVAIVLTGGAQSGSVGQAMSPSPAIQIRDSDGKPVAGIVFAVIVVSGGGTVTGTPAQTVEGASTTIGTWTLGTVPGPQVVRIESTGLPPLEVTVTANPGPPASSTSGSGPLTAAGTVGTVSVLQPSIRILDAFGNAISGRTITVAISGGGTISTPNPVTNSAGIASVGTWTLGPLAGEQTVTLTPGGTASAIVFRSTTEAGPPTSMTAASGATTGIGAPGGPAPFVPSVRLADAFGNSIAGVVVSAAVSAGGAIGNASPATNASGVASVGSWTLAAIGGAENTVTVTIPTIPTLAPVVFTVTTTATAFSIEIEYYGAIAPTPAVQTAINNAVNRLQQVIVGDLPDAAVNGTFNGCFPGLGPINRVVDDIRVYVRITAEGFDGTNGLLARAGPCFVPGTNTRGFTIVGLLDIDVDDVASMTSSGILGNVLTHELLHALGVGTLWQPFNPPLWPHNFMSGAGSGNPIFVGPLARAAFVAAGGATAEGVPAQLVAEAHWRPNIFGNELMVFNSHAC